MAQDNALRLSPHFTLGEFTYSLTAVEKAIDNQLPPELLPRAVATAKMLERIRESLNNRAIILSSGYRCELLNRLVGGNPKSDHRNADAADISVPSFGGAYNVAKALEPAVNDLQIGQLIVEGLRGKRWVHVSTHRPENPINRVLTITAAGPVPGIHPIE